CPAQHASNRGSSILQQLIGAPRQYSCATHKYQRLLLPAP
ncbi:hypothetical protein A2U01_0076560, partial [Trifolium medium]|nr:hypothetical protein [Trifolium medium]